MRARGIQTANNLTAHHILWVYPTQGNTGHMYYGALSDGPGTNARAWNGGRLRPGKRARTGDEVCEKGKRSREGGTIEVREAQAQGLLPDA